LGGKRLRGEILLSAAAALVPPDPDPPTPDAPPPPPASPHPPASATFDVRALVEPDLWDQIPSDVPELLALLPNADLYVQDEVDVRHHPTLTRVWSRKGRHGQRKVRAPGWGPRAVGFAAVDWRDGWCSWGFAPGRTADVFAQQLDHLVERSGARRRVALVVCDNDRIHTARGAKVVREALEHHRDRLRVVPTPAYDPSANPTERLWGPFRRRVTHNHHRDEAVDLFRDAFRFFAELDARPERILRHIGSPFAINAS